MRHLPDNALARTLNSVWLYVRGKRNYAFVAAFILLVAYASGITFESVETIVFFSVFFVLASFSTVYKRYFRAPPVFELMTLGTVVMTAKFGFVPGFIFGALSQVSSEVISGTIDAQILIFVPSRAALAASTWLAIHAFGVEPRNLFVLGMVAVVTYNLLVQPVSWMMGDMQLKAKTIYYTVGYTIMNFFIFTILSGPVAFIVFR